MLITQGLQNHILLNVFEIFLDFYLTAKTLRAQRKFDGVLMTYYFIFLGVHLGGFFETTPPIFKKSIQKRTLKDRHLKNSFKIRATTGYSTIKSKLEYKQGSLYFKVPCL